VLGTDPITQEWSYGVLLGNGDGSFQPAVFHPQSVTTGAERYSVVVADFNNDHKLDVAVSSGNDSLALLLGNGDGTFAPPAYLFDAAATWLISADFNGDGKLDIAAGGTNATVETALLFGNGDGTEFPAVSTSRDLCRDHQCNIGQLEPQHSSASDRAVGRGLNSRALRISS
jgi:hypothetical protein